MLKAILIDDEKECLNSLKIDLEKHCPEVEILTVCQGGKEGIKAINQYDPDLIFLDIDMPHIGGFDLIEMIPNLTSEIIFTTAYDKYALQAFRISALDYLLKPIDIELLKQSVTKVKEKKQKQGTSQQMSFLLTQLKDLENDKVEKIALPTFETVEFIDFKDILYCQSDGSYSYVHFCDGSKIYISKTLRYLEEALCDYNFFRVHNSYIINTDYVKKYVKADGGYLIMNNGVNIKVSRSKKEELLNLF